MPIEEGIIVEGTVANITKFGAFVQLAEGKTGLVHISEIADTYIKDINRYLKEKQKVMVKVLNIDTPGRNTNLPASSWTLAQPPRCSWS